MKRQIIVFSGLFVLLLLFSIFSSNALAIQYRVQNGDTLYSISKKFGVSLHEIKQANNLQKSRIKPKQILNISSEEGSVGSSSKHSAKSKSKPVYYTVKKGDTLSRIAKRTHHPMKQIAALNHINNKSLHVGQKIVLAKSTYVSAKSEPVPEDNDLTAEEDDATPDVVNENDTKETTEASNDEPERKGELLGKWNSPDEMQLFVKVATGFIGAPYRFGGSSLKGIDCSSFVQKIYRIFDVTLPRNAAQQSKVGISISRENLTQGDLVFFHTKRSLGHVGIYIGNNEFVHASSKKRGVRVDSLDTPYYQKRFQRAVRIKGLDSNTGA
ncbi:MAG: NlpC/P60 family protein [Smithella sp.]|jgi:cell wall-associated NlpC family hydrolase